MDQFLQALLKEAASAAGDELKTVNFDQDLGILHMEIDGEVRALTPAVHFQEYSKLQTSEAQAKFITNIVKTHVVGASARPQEYKEALPILKPRLQTASYFRLKCCELPQGQTLPFCGIDGKEFSALLDPKQSSETDLGVCVVMDFGHAIVPVLGADLVRWDITFEQCLKLALANLRKSSAKSPADWKFTKHASACCQSEWHDGFDSTRAALLPDMTQAILPGSMVGDGTPSGGDTVVVFASHSQAYAAGSKNPLSLCFMGDMVLDVLKQVESANSDQTASQITRVSLSLIPYRLVETPVPASPHPLHVFVPQSGKKKVYSWRRYVRQSNEFSIPSNQSEIDAILDGAQTGKVPVFDEKPEPKVTPKPAETKEMKRDRLKAEGNKFFGQKKWSLALSKYSEALEVDPSNHILYGNRAACHLKQAASATNAGKPADAAKFANSALADSTKATELNSSWSKGWSRKGAALELLGKLEEATGAYQSGLALDGLKSPEKKALQDSLAAVQAKIKEAAEKAEVEEKQNEKACESDDSDSDEDRVPDMEEFQEEDQPVPLFSLNQKV